MAGQEHLASDDEHPCASDGYSTFNRTDVVGSGELELALDRYDSDSGTDPDKNKCALKCTLEAIGVYWACAIKCIEDEGPTSCITAKCLATVVAFDTPCLKKCDGDNVAV